MEPAKFRSEKTHVCPGLLSTVTDLETETALATALSQRLMEDISVTIIETNRWREAQKITFEINSPNTPGAIQAVRGLSDTELGRILSEGLGGLTSSDLFVTVRRRSYGQSFRPAKALLEPIRVCVFIEDANRGGGLDARKTAA